MSQEATSGTQQPAPQAPAVVVPAQQQMSPGGTVSQPAAMPGDAAPAQVAAPKIGTTVDAKPEGGAHGNGAGSASGPQQWAATRAISLAAKQHWTPEQQEQFRQELEAVERRYTESTGTGSERKARTTVRELEAEHGRELAEMKAKLEQLERAQREAEAAKSQERHLEKVRRTVAHDLDPSLDPTARSKMEVDIAGFLANEYGVGPDANFETLTAGLERLRIDRPYMFRRQSMAPGVAGLVAAQAPGVGADEHRAMFEAGFARARRYR